MSQVLLVAELRSAARYAGLSLADRAADRIEELETILALVLATHDWHGDDGRDAAEKAYAALGIE